MIWTALAIVIIAVIVGYIIFRTSYRSKLIVGLGFLIICISVVIYLIKGQIEYSDQPYMTLKKQEALLKSLSEQELITQFEQRLKQQDSAEARLVLANTFVRLGKINQAEQHYKQAYQLDNNKTPNVILAYSEYLIVKNNFTVTNQVLELINTALQIDANNIKGLFFQGLFYVQNKQNDNAIKSWQNMVKNLQDIPYHRMLKQHLIEIITQYKIDKTKVGI
jgi:cytochrome c-type biogenesis protein CcmH/NrfG